MKRPAPANRLSNPGGTPDQWAVSAALEPLDKVAADHEARWGVGVLERLVAPATAARFASARKRLDDAIEGGDWQEVARRADVLIRGWKALDAEALAAGHEPGDPGRTWTIVSDGETRYVFVQHERDAQLAAKKFPDHQVWAMSEVARILDSRNDSLFAVAAEAKRLFPGSTVGVTAKARKPLNDAVPF